MNGLIFLEEHVQLLQILSFGLFFSLILTEILLGFHSVLLEGLS
jgi:hypothetical protein